jgi:hypothetical protein
MVKISLIVSVDTECDKGPRWQIKRPLSFLNVIKGIPDKLQPLFNEFSVKPTYLLSPELLMHNSCTRLFQSLQKKVELGVHMHGEFIEPYADWNAKRTDAFQGDFSPRVEFQKISDCTKLFEEKFCFHPTSFRAGRFGLSRYTLFFLEELGYSIDSSMTPYVWWWRRKGEGVNFLGVPNQPYFPSPHDFRKRGKMSILEVPISIVNPFWERFPVCLIRKINPLNRIQTILMNAYLRNKLRSLWLRPTYSSVEQMIFVTDRIVKMAKTKRPILNMMFHSNEATPGMSPYNQTENDVNSFLSRLRNYFAILNSKFDVQSITLSEAIRLV